MASVRSKSPRRWVSASLVTLISVPLARPEATLLALGFLLAWTRTRDAPWRRAPQRHAATTLMKPFEIAWTAARPLLPPLYGVIRRAAREEIARIGARAASLMWAGGSPTTP